MEVLKEKTHSRADIHFGDRNGHTYACQFLLGKHTPKCH